MVENQARNIRCYRYKTWFDYGILILAHVILLPLWLSVWAIVPLLIWAWDRGPVFYRQERTGKDGKRFTIIKFRTMVPGADRKGPVWTMPADPRVTPIGRLLRRTALDELPELISIWKGDMSLVGPRALGAEEHRTLEQQIPGFAQRLQVPPGLTGLAQVYDQTDCAPNKFRYDLEYINTMGPMLDLKLLALSVWNTLGGRWDQRSGKLAEPDTTSGRSVNDVPDEEMPNLEQGRIKGRR